MEDEAVKFPVVLNSMKEGSFTFYFFIYFLYVNACGMHMCVCVVWVWSQEEAGGCPAIPFLTILLWDWVSY